MRIIWNALVIAAIAATYVAVAWALCGPRFEALLLALCAGVGTPAFYLGKPTSSEGVNFASTTTMVLSVAVVMVAVLPRHAGLDPTLRFALAAALFALAGWAPLLLRKARSAAHGH
ncbi:MAG TPA: hypothetical protein VHC68_00080 [Candidatus Paceibacterota bacterium]|nr:hypothetical protein [Candidatus Paceibacterota bacterium]